MEIRNSLLTLAGYALRGATTDAEQLAVYDALATAAAAVKDGDSGVILAAARDTAIAIRKADDARLNFRDLVQGQLPLTGGVEA